MSRLVNLPDDAKLLRLTHGFAEDFHGFLTATSTALWTLVTAVDGTATLLDAVGGRLSLVNGVATIGDDEDSYLAREPESFLPAAAKPIYFDALVQFTQVSDATNVIVGLTDAVAANLLVSAGAGPKTSGTTIAFFCREGSLNWYVHASLSTTQTSVELTAANSLTKTAQVAGGATYQRLSFEFIPKNATQSDIVFYIDGTPVYKITDWVFTSATEAQAVFGLKGGTAAAHTLVCDYIQCYQVR